MRAKQSSTASGMYSRLGTLTIPPPILADGPPERRFTRRSFAGASDDSVFETQPEPDVAEAEGLLHDARNLMNALGLYCDLLGMPGVLKPEHSHYAEELRLIGSRTGALVQRWMDGPERRVGHGSLRGDRRSGVRQGERGDGPAAGKDVLIGPMGSDPELDAAADCHSTDLQQVVERCAGLLSRLAGGRTIELCYGDLPGVPVAVAEEAIERILVNLVRNAAAALEARPGGAGELRIGVGLHAAAAGLEARMRLTVEDSGCGMDREQMERVARGGAGAGSADGHGLGLRVVRELVQASGGRLRVMSTPGVGTRVHIDWPVEGVDRALRAARRGSPRGREARRSGQFACSGRSVRQAVSFGGFA